MSEPIKVGDLVMVAKPTNCCNYFAGIGKIYTVIPFHDRRPTWKCVVCGFVDVQPEDSVKLSNRGAYERRRLKRIPPLEELEQARDYADIQNTLSLFDRVKA